MNKLKRYGPLIPFLLSVGLQLSPWHSVLLAVVLIFIAALLAFLVYWPYIRQIRLRTPIFLSSLKTSSIPKTDIDKTTAATQRLCSRLKHDGVLWEDTGTNYLDSGEVVVEGPLCPKDYCPLGLRHGNGREQAKTNWRADTFISNYQLHAVLFCPECKATYTLGSRAKQLKQSHDEVQNRFEGLRKRQSNT